MILFYRETETDDYLAIDAASNAYYLGNFGKDHFEGRATAIIGLLGSVCTTGIAREYLREKCKRVAKKSVPEEWRQAIGC
jgi:hypothetical protein